ncbi:MAG: hypothetical protein JWN04_760 [Myxococcaceae bacterium]|nr:hypothetical protein [Myxococcaceae bacterium]
MCCGAEGDLMVEASPDGYGGLAALFSHGRHLASLDSWCDRPDANPRAYLQLAQPPSGRVLATIARLRVVHYGQGAEDTWEYHAVGTLCSDDSQCDEHICVTGYCRSAGEALDGSVATATDAGIADDASTPRGLDSGLNPVNTTMGSTTSDAGVDSAASSAEKKHHDSGCALGSTRRRADMSVAGQSLLLRLRALGLRASARSRRA